MAPELVVVAIAFVIAAVVMWRARRIEGGAPAGKAVALLVVSAAGASALAGFVRPPPAPPPPSGIPPRSHEDGYASSDACRSCHPSEHASWSRTFHRTMTQRAEPSAVRAPLPAAMELDGLTYEVAVEAGRVVAGRPGKKEPVLLTTGSHHYQAFWVAGERPGELALFPLVYVFREARWLARRDVFLQPPGTSDAASGHGARWNSNCLACHAVAGRPGHDEDTNVFRTREAELGIACEACHGPGEAHAAARRNPIARVSQNGTSDPTIVNPARLGAERASAVCGQCHSFAYPRDEATWWSAGYATSFHPGDALETSRFVLFPETLGEKGAPKIEAAEASLYWSDGTIRVGGREYNGLVRSPCFEHGDGDRKMSCLSCHSMHASDPDDQLRTDRSTSATCLGCHAGRDAPAHVRHAAGSPATQCESCHMPKTTYALLKSIRSHRIESPNVATALATGRPTACNLCHLSRSLGWTADRLDEWYGAKSIAIPADVRDVPVAAFLALRGDAAMRALVAAAMGEPDSRAASGAGWQRGVLSVLRADDYAAVRLIAERSSASFPGTDDVELVDAETRKSLLARRDTRAITISE